MSSQPLKEIEAALSTLAKNLPLYLYGLGGRISNTNAKIDGLDFRHGAQLTDLSLRLRIIEAQLGIEPSLDWALPTPTPTVTDTGSVATPTVETPTSTPEGGT